MENEVKEFLGNFDKEALEAEAYFGIRQYGGGSEESFIYANKSGLLRYSISLLEGYLQVDEVLKSSDSTIIHMPEGVDWIDIYGDTFVDYIKPTNKKKNELVENNDETKTWKDKLIAYLFVGIMLGFICLTIIGFFTVIKWI
jgi:hypothetical protein